MSSPTLPPSSHLQPTEAIQVDNDLNTSASSSNNNIVVVPTLQAQVVDEQAEQAREARLQELERLLGAFETALPTPTPTRETQRSLEQRERALQEQAAQLARERYELEQERNFILQARLEHVRQLSSVAGSSVTSMSREISTEQPAATTSSSLLLLPSARSISQASPPVARMDSEESRDPAEPMNLLVEVSIGNADDDEPSRIPKGRAAPPNHHTTCPSGRPRRVLFYVSTILPALVAMALLVYFLLLVADQNDNPSSTMQTAAPTPTLPTTTSPTGAVRPPLSVSSWKQLGTDWNGKTAGAELGYAVALSQDGSVMAVGAPHNDGIGVGYVQVYEYENDAGWRQLGDDLFGKEPVAGFGDSVAVISHALSGTIILAVGAGQGSAATFGTGFVSVNPVRPL